MSCKSDSQITSKRLAQRLLVQLRHLSWLFSFCGDACGDDVSSFLPHQPLRQHLLLAPKPLLKLKLQAQQALRCGWQRMRKQRTDQRPLQRSGFSFLVLLGDKWIMLRFDRITTCNGGLSRSLTSFVKMFQASKHPAASYHRSAPKLRFSQSCIANLRKRCRKGAHSLLRRNKTHMRSAAL